MTEVEAVAGRLLAWFLMLLAAGSGIAISPSLNGCVVPIPADAVGDGSIDRLR
jgi:hypothetical protein